MLWEEKDSLNGGRIGIMGEERCGRGDRKGRVQMGRGMRAEGGVNKKRGLNKRRECE